MKLWSLNRWLIRFFRVALMVTMDVEDTVNRDSTLLEFKRVKVVDGEVIIKEKT